MSVQTAEMPYGQAVSSGAVALFDEKYGDTVRVVKVSEPPVSAELCGGTHITATGEIGFFHIISESSIGAGLRRIEAVTGRSAEDFVDKQLAALIKVSETLGCAASDVEEKASALTAEMDKERKLREAVEKELFHKIAESLVHKAAIVNGVNILAEYVPGARLEVLRDMSDYLRGALKSAVIVLATVQDDKPAFLSAVTDDLVKKGYNAGNIVKKVAQVTGGSGGGKPNLAQAGGKDKSKIEEALALVKTLVQ
jgi:alanyl-tRNA synthetase